MLRGKRSQEVQEPAAPASICIERGGAKRDDANQHRRPSASQQPGSAARAAQRRRCEGRHASLMSQNLLQSARRPWSACLVVVAGEHGDVAAEAPPRVLVLRLAAQVVDPVPACAVPRVQEPLHLRPPVAPQGCGTLPT